MDRRTITGTEYLKLVRYMGNYDSLSNVINMSETQEVINDIRNKISRITHLSDGGL